MVGHYPVCVFIHLISKHMTTLCNCVLQATRNLRQHRPGIKTTPPLHTHEIVMNVMTKTDFVGVVTHLT